jgi:transposase
VSVTAKASASSCGNETDRSTSDTKGSTARALARITIEGKSQFTRFRAACERRASVAGWGLAPRPSADFRERLVLALDAGLAPSEAARLFGVDRRTVFRWRARHRRGESLAEQPRSGRPPKLDPARYEQLRAVVLTHPDATLPEHVARLAAVTGVSLSPSHLSRLLAKLGLRLKKEPDRRRTRRGGPCRLAHGDGQG